MEELFPEPKEEPEEQKHELIHRTRHDKISLALDSYVTNFSVQEGLFHMRFHNVVLFPHDLHKQRMLQFMIRYNMFFGLKDQTQFELLTVPFVNLADGIIAIDLCFTEILDSLRTLLRRSIRVIMNVPNYLNVPKPKKRRAERSNGYQEDHSYGCFANAEFVMFIFRAIYTLCKISDYHKHRPERDSFKHVSASIREWNSDVVTQFKGDILVKPLYYVIAQDPGDMSFGGQDTSQISGLKRFFRILRQAIATFFATPQWEHITRVKKQTIFATTEFYKQHRAQRLIKQMIENDCESKYFSSIENLSM